MGMDDNAARPSQNIEKRGPVLRRADQLCLALLVIAALAAIAMFWYGQGLSSGRMIDIEQARPLQTTFQVDINSATWPEWLLLPGIGEGLARRIVESREREGRFRDVGDLRRVSGMGPKTMAKIQPYLLPVDTQDHHDSSTVE